MTSRLARTQETLALALDGRDVPVVIASELDEIHFGSFDGGLLDDYRAWAASEPPDVPAPGGGESRAQAAARFARGLRLVLARPEERVLVVGHALAIRYVVDATDGLGACGADGSRRARVPVSPRARRAGEGASLLEEWSRTPQFRVDVIVAAQWSRCELSCPAHRGDDSPPRPDPAGGRGDLPRLGRCGLDVPLARPRRARLPRLGRPRESRPARRRVRGGRAVLRRRARREVVSARSDQVSLSDRSRASRCSVSR